MVGEKNMRKNKNDFHFQKLACFQCVKREYSLIKCKQEQFFILIYSSI